MTEMSKSYADALFSLALETNTVFETLTALKEMRRRPSEMSSRSM